MSYKNNDNIGLDENIGFRHVFWETIIVFCFIWIFFFRVSYFEFQKKSSYFQNLEGMGQKK